MSETIVLTEADLAKVYEDTTVSVVCRCEVATAIIGSQPASRKAVEQFVVHHLGLPDNEVDAAVSRILEEEIGEREDLGGNEKGEGELTKRLSYGVNVLRADPRDGCRYIGSWMLKAAIKVAMSRHEVFTKKRGSKGDVSELGTVTAHGISAVKSRDTDEAMRASEYNPPHKRVRLINPDGSPYMGGIYKPLRGHVTTPQGSRSIIQDAEIAPPGTKFEFRFRFKGTKLSVGDVRTALASIRVIGVGSARSLDHGEFRVLSAEIHDADRLRGRANVGPEKKKVAKVELNPGEILEAPGKPLPRIGDVRGTIGAGVK